MITLYGFGAGFGLPENQPLCDQDRGPAEDGRVFAYRKEKSRPPAL